MPFIYFQFLTVAIKSYIKTVWICHTHHYMLKTFVNLKISNINHFITFHA